MRSPARTIVIIGGGFSGTSLATSLLQRPPAGRTHVVLIERRAAIGQGVAYQPNDPLHLLNVPASRMSADSADPDQFIRFVQQRDPTLHSEEFLPRPLYGEYLRQRLIAAQRTAPPHITLDCIQGNAHAIHRIDTDGPYLIDIDSRQRVLADDVVLACGDPPPASPSFARHLDGHGAYVCDPFRDDAVRADTQTLLLIGTGLTMADVVVSAAQRAPGITIHALSRHGLLPAKQTSQGGHTPAQNPFGATPPRTVRDLLRSFHAALKATQAAGGDWRDVINGARPHVSAIWSDLPRAEQQRFLRHLRCRWDAHRHRLPPAVASRLGELRQHQQLHIHAGQIEELSDEHGRLRVRWRVRGQPQRRELLVDRVVNCTGADRRLENTQDPLLRDVLQQGYGLADALGLGIRTTDYGALIGRNGQPANHLFYLGPMLRAGHWEATAVGELRVHVDRLAQRLLQSAPA